MIKSRQYWVNDIFLALSVFWHNPALAQLTRDQRRLQRDQRRRVPAWVAKDAEFLRRTGSMCSWSFFTGGTTAVMALVSADTPIAQLAGPAVINSVLAGSDAVLIVGGVTSLNYYLMGRPEIKTPRAARRRLRSDQPLPVHRRILSLATLCQKSA